MNQQNYRVVSYNFCGEIGQIFKNLSFETALFVANTLSDKSVKQQNGKWYVVFQTEPQIKSVYETLHRRESYVN